VHATGFPYLGERFIAAMSVAALASTSRRLHAGQFQERRPFGDFRAEQFPELAGE
jgi:hypothetical protein